MASILSREDPLEQGMATHSSILAWRIPRTEEPGGGVHGVAKSRTQLKRLSRRTHCSPVQLSVGACVSED